MLLFFIIIYSLIPKVKTSNFIRVSFNLGMKKKKIDIPLIIIYDLVQNEDAFN